MWARWPTRPRRNVRESSYEDQYSDRSVLLVASKTVVNWNPYNHFLPSNIRVSIC